MIKFLKAQASSITATFFDFSTTIVLVEVFKLQPLLASVVGTVVGGITNFLVNRYWVFEAVDSKVPVQAAKYVLVWAGSMMLNAAGMYIMTSYLGYGYVLSKVLVSLLVGFGYNYVLQKKFVFK